MVAEFPDRPAPPQPFTGRIRSWLEWVGPGRVAGSAVVVLAVLAGTYWLVKPPPATTESKLPYASTTTVASAGSYSTTSSTTAAPTAASLIVHVAGAVLAPGVYHLTAGTRVIDAVRAAGGLAGDAYSDAVNLAAPLVDGERVFVPRVGEPPPVVEASGSRTGQASAAATGPVNLNTATADDLDALPGVGPATAAAILAHRDQMGPFGAVDDLADVRGIGPAKLDALRGLVTV